MYKNKFTIFLIILFLLCIFYFSKKLKEKKFVQTLIPKVVYYTFKNKNFNKEIVDIIEHNKKICPTYEFKFYDNDECEKFIKQNFDSNIYKAYKKINPNLGAMKADFWRYCILYKNGGIYIDIKNKFTKNLDDIIKPNDTCILNTPNTDGELRENLGIPVYEQWLLIFQKEHIYLKKMIDNMVKNILNNYEPQTTILNYEGITKTKQKILHITGPDAFSLAISTCKKNHRIVPYNTFIHIDTDAKYKLYNHAKIKHYENVDESLYVKN